MALTGILNKKDPVHFVLTSFDSKIFYIKTTQFSTSRELIDAANGCGVNLKQVNTDKDRDPISYCSGYFISAQIIDAHVASPVYNKIWEIVK